MSRPQINKFEKSERAVLALAFVTGGFAEVAWALSALFVPSTNE